MSKFLMGYNSELQFISINLPPGRYAHPMPDFVISTITKLRNIAEDPYLFFREELLECLNDNQLAKLISDLECGAQKIYEFVKNRIWYIMVHQQQVEGLFNKWDLKTHPNITSNLQQSKLRLASLPLTEIGCNLSDLTELRIKKRQQQTELTNNSISIKENLNNSDGNREESANKLFEDLFERK
ncbi:hypothetical protein C2G38_2036486 [Gigaspora rosea]|uniref:Uncharacterized protein n=1 Tax=Gigaspora rosea TaxID=44941 RepID=A0A397VI17_9GLOM|nr:hypothetical protein C2G38_2036486 [Gigaspora rosea]